ncbi:hypothetical protein GCM10023080_026290 [Streptomyces pseudoechinosporeus]
MTGGLPGGRDADTAVFGVLCVLPARIVTAQAGDEARCDLRGEQSQAAVAAAARYAVGRGRPGETPHLHMSAEACTEFRPVGVFCITGPGLSEGRGPIPYLSMTTGPRMRG